MTNKEAAELKIEKRTKNQIYLMGGADYRITVDDNPGLCRYLKSRCYAAVSYTHLDVYKRQKRMLLTLS